VLLSIFLFVYQLSRTSGTTISSGCVAHLYDINTDGHFAENLNGGKIVYWQVCKKIYHPFGALVSSLLHLL